MTEVTPNLLSCAAAQRDLTTFAGSLIPAERARALRAHLQSCAACKALYVEAVETAASVGKKVRVDREDRDDEMRELRIEAAIAGRNDTLERAHKSRFFSLRMVLIPAFFFFLMMFVSRAMRGPNRVKLLEWQGVAEAAGQVLENGGEAPRLIRGSWLRTDHDGSMTVTFAKTRLELDGRTHLMILATDAAEFQLRSGAMTVNGEAEITTPLGVAEVDGQAEIRVSGSDFELLCKEGTAQFIDASGSKSLTPGQEYRR